MKLAGSKERIPKSPTIPAVVVVSVSAIPTSLRQQDERHRQRAKAQVSSWVDIRMYIRSLVLRSSLSIYLSLFLFLSNCLFALSVVMK